MDVIGFNRVDDFVQNHTTTGVGRGQRSATGTINPAGDQDWFSHSDRGVHYRFNQNGSPSGVERCRTASSAFSASHIDSTATPLISDDDGYTVNSNEPDLQP